MNILELQDNLKDLPDNALMQEMQAPTGSAPQFLVLSELKRRKRMRDDFQRQQNADMPTVAEEVVTAAGMPQEGIMGAARAMAPNTNMAQNTGMDTATPIPATRAPQPQMMAEGGIVRMANGGIPMYSPAAAENLRARPGTITRLGGDVERIARLREEYPELYEQYKDDPNALAQLAAATIEEAQTPELTGLEELETPRSAEFLRNIFLDPTSGMIKEQRQSDTAEFGEDYGLQQSIDTQQNIRDRVRAGDDSLFAEGSVVEMLKGTPGYAFPRKSEAYDISGSMVSSEVEDFVAPQVGEEAVSDMGVRTSSGFGNNPLGAPEIGSLPDFSGVEKDQLQDEISAYLAGELYDNPRKNIGFLEKRDLLNQGLAYEGNRRRGYLPNEILSSEVGNPLHQDRSDLEYAQNKLGQREKLNMSDVERAGADEVLFDGSIEDKLKYDGPMNYYLEGQATKYYQDDQYTPPEEIYSGDPREIAKYQGASDEEIQLISDRLAAEASADEAKKIATTEARRDIEEELSRQDAANFLAINQPMSLTDAESAQLKAKGIVDPIYSEIEERQAERNELEKLTEQADIERGGYEAAAKQEAAEQKALEDIAEIDAATTSRATSGDFGSTDSRIAKMLSDRQKQAESDKWMALAFAGMELMKPTATIGEGLGKAGQAGLGYLQQSKKGLQNFETDMLKLETQLEAARIRGQKSGGLTLNQYLARGEDLITAGQKMVENAGDNADAAERGQALIARGMALINTVTGGANTNSGGSKAVNIS